MKYAFSFVVSLIILCATSAWANQTHPVVKGESLSTIGVKLGVDWHKIAEENKISAPHMVRIGQKLIVPEKTSDKKKLITPKITKRAKKTFSVATKKMVTGTKENPASYTDDEVGDDPWRGTIAEGLKLLGFDIPKGASLRFAGEGMDVLSSGAIIQMVSGKDKVKWYRAELSPEKAKVWKLGVIVNGSRAGSVYAKPECANWLIWEKSPVPVKKVEIPPAPVAPEVIPETPPELPPIFREVVEEKECVQCEHEVDAGMGAWQNKERDAHGLWWYAQYLLTLQRCEDGNINIFGGTLVPKVGVFAKGDLGETDAGYEWNSPGIGPEIGFIWTGLADNGYPHQVQFMFRTLWEHLHGENSSSGYHKDEDHFLLGYYAEYLRQFAPELMAVLYAEGWFDVSGSINSSWSGDEVSDRAGFVIGAKIHKYFSEDWAGRLGAQIGFAPHEDRWGLNLNAEARYREWLMFGPSLDYTLASAVAGAAGGYSYGAFVRFELKHEVRKKYSVIRTEEVKPADHQLLQY
jgi:hypothetical protein